MRTVFFREDDYDMKELLPLSAVGEFLDEIYKNETFGSARTDNISFADTYTNEDAAKPLRGLKLTSQKLRDTLFFLPAFDKVETGCDDFGRKCEYINAVGTDKGVTVYWSSDGNGLVEALWLTLKAGEGREETKKILAALGKLAPVILADRKVGCCVDLSSGNDIDEYIKEYLI